MAIPLDEQLAEADAAVVGRVVSEESSEDGEAPARVLRVDVEQRVKGELEDETEDDGKLVIFVQTPYRTDCDLTVDPERTVGLLLGGDGDGGWIANLCSLADPGELVALGGEPRGGPIKVVIGVAILLLVLGWSFRRLKRGDRPHLPGAPGP